MVNHIKRNIFRTSGELEKQKPMIRMDSLVTIFLCSLSIDCKKPIFRPSP